MSRARSPFQTIRSEGGLLPADFLQRLGQRDGELAGMRDADYHASDLPLNERIVRSWNRLVGAWAGFREARSALPEGDPGTTPTRERWLLVLFEELGYGRLQTARAVEIEGKTYPVSHAWGSVPIHLVGCNVSLERPTRGVAGAARHSPHGLVQELLNRSEERLWGFVSNGLLLRVLRDNSALTRQAYVEFDLEEMLESEAYADFALLWLLCHVSRLEGERPHSCWLERWAQEAARQGTRALDALRDGVERALEALGAGFLAHPTNGALREALRSGELSAQDYYRELLRLVYRLLFLFVAEDRGLLLSPGASVEARERYARWYSTERLRRLAERRRGSKHADLYEGLKLVMTRLGEDEGCPELGLPALGSFLWSREALPHLGGAQLANAALLEAVRALATVREGRVLRPVDYRNLGAEELGSVYESLLELHPELNADAGTFALATAAGHERKTTGSYYTPSSLVSCLLDSALDPLLEEAARKGEEAILELKVCDPACGSGHFLVASAHRIAKRLAALRTGDEEPSPEATRAALRDVVSRCLYGVDANPLAVELCKVSLWLEALDPGRPLSFLDAHVKCGNSLLGTTAELMAQGIPDDAFKALEGDDKEVAKALRAQNRREREGQLSLEDAAGDLVGALERRAAALEAADDATLEGLHAKERLFAELLRSEDYARAKLVADAWCAAFLQRKARGAPRITTGLVRRLASGEGAVPEEAIAEIRRLAAEYAFFHWEIEYPSVFGRVASGFDVVLGNPPWKALSPDLFEFFGAFEPDLRSMPQEAQQARIEELLEDGSVAASWRDYRRSIFGTVLFLRSSGAFTLYAPGNLGKGDLNLYRMFIELAVRRARQGGYATQVTPGALYSGANTSAIRQWLLDQCRLDVLVGCDNITRAWFDVSVNTICVYAARTGGSTRRIRAVFGVMDDAVAALADPRRAVELSADEIREGAPDTYVIPEVLDAFDLLVTKKLYDAAPPFGSPEAGWGDRAFRREVDMGNDRDLFTTDPEGLAVYEGRMIDRYDYRAKAYVSGHGARARWEERPFGDPRKAIVPQWRVRREDIPAKVGDNPYHYRLVWQDIADPSMARSFVAAMVPPGSICGHKVPTLMLRGHGLGEHLYWLALANSLCLDFLARKRLKSKTMTFTTVDSLPFPRLPRDDQATRQIVYAALRLIATGPEMTTLWNLVASEGWCAPVEADSAPPGLIDPADRSFVEAEIDAHVALCVFGLARPETEFVIDSFEKVGSRDVKAHGEYRTKRLILEIYDELAEAIATGRPYQSRLDPPPADPRVAHPPRRAVADTAAQAGQ